MYADGYKNTVSTNSAVAGPTDAGNHPACMWRISTLRMRRDATTLEEAANNASSMSFSSSSWRLLLCKSCCLPMRRPLYTESARHGFGSDPGVFGSKMHVCLDGTAPVRICGLSGPQISNFRHEMRVCRYGINDVYGMRGVVRPRIQKRPGSRTEPPDTARVPDASCAPRADPLAYARPAPVLTPAPYSGFVRCRGQKTVA